MSPGDTNVPPDNRTDPGTGSGPPRYPGTFFLAFREAVAGLGWEVRRWQGPMAVVADAAGQEHTVGLENLFRRVRPAERGDWPELITEFLRIVGESDRTEELPADLAGVADRLLIRLGLPFQPRISEAPIWCAPVGDTGLVVNLVVDYPNRMVYVPEKMVEESGQPGSVWLDQALANLKGRTPPECFQPVHEESGLLACSVTDSYESSRAMILDALLPAGAEHGFFVGLPGRDQLIVLPVSVQNLAYVPLVKILAERNFKSTPYPISGEVYWVRGRDWQHFPITLQGQKVEIEPPDEFVELMDQLRVEEGEEPEQTGSE